MQDYSIPALAAVADGASLADIVFSRAERQPATVILRRRSADSTWHDVTAAAFRDEVAALARSLIAAGVEPGDRIGLMSATRYEWTLIDYAIWAAGAVTVPVYETSSAEQIEWILGDSGARAVFAETGHHRKLIESARERLDGLSDVWPVDDPASLAQQLTGEATLVDDEELAQRRGARTADDLATIIYTSGTTGRPKGCEISHRNLLADVRNAVSVAPEVFESGGASTLLFLPLAHSFARIIQVGCIESGAVLGHWPDSRTLAQGLPEFGPTFLLGVPRVFEKVFNSAQQQASESGAKKRIFAAATDTAIAWSRARDEGAGRAGARLGLRHRLFDRLVYARLRAAVGGRIQYAVSGGAPLGDRLGHFFRGAGITVLEGYGLTETSAASTVNPPSRNKIGTVGPPLPGVSIRIADDGEILVRGANVFAGYWRNADATTEVMGNDGWFHTGDLGELDETGYLRVTGRKKELIVTAGGKNVAPAVLEDRLRAYPLVSQCMAVGDGRSYIACLITLDTEALGPWKQQHGKPADATPADLAGDEDLRAEIQAAVDDANKAVSRAESIRRFVILRTDFTEENGALTPSLKIRRAVVARDFADDIEGLYR